MIYGTLKWNRKCLIIPGIFNRIFWNLVRTSSFDDINLLWKNHIDRISVSYLTDISCMVSWPVIIERHVFGPFLKLIFSPVLGQRRRYPDKSSLRQKTMIFCSNLFFRNKQKFDVYSFMLCIKKQYNTNISIEREVGKDNGKSA